MQAIRDRVASILEKGWDSYSLQLMLVLLAFLLAVWLLYRILHQRSQAGRISAVANDIDSTLIAKVPPPPLPKLDQLLARLENDSSEFVAIVRGVLQHTPYKKLMGHAELRRKFAHLETLLQRSERPVAKGTLGINRQGALTSPETRRDAKATMLTIIRLLQDVEGVQERSDAVFESLVDRFLEKV